MTICPYCKRRLRSKLKKKRMAIDSLPSRQKIIYDSIAKAGPMGIKTSELISKIDSYGPGGGVVMRVQVHELNKVLLFFGERVRGSGGVYRLKSVWG